MIDYKKLLLGLQSLFSVIGWTLIIIGQTTDTDNDNEIMIMIPGF